MAITEAALECKGTRLEHCFCLYLLFERKNKLANPCYGHCFLHRATEINASSFQRDLIGLYFSRKKATCVAEYINFLGRFSVPR